jgi:hypothetical protein
MAEGEETDLDRTRDEAEPETENDQSARRERAGRTTRRRGVRHWPLTVSRVVVRLPMATGCER